MWNHFITPGWKIASPIISAGVAAKTENLQSAKITSNFSRSLTGGKFLPSTDLSDNGLRLRVM